MKEHFNIPVFTFHSVREGASSDDLFALDPVYFEEVMAFIAERLEQSI